MALNMDSATEPTISSGHVVRTVLRGRMLLEVSSLRGLGQRAASMDGGALVSLTAVAAAEL